MNAEKPKIVNSNGEVLTNVDKNMFHLCLYIYLNFNKDFMQGKFEDYSTLDSF